MDKRYHISVLILSFAISVQNTANMRKWYPFIFVPIDCEKFLTNSQIITNKMRDDDGLYVGLKPDYQKKVSYDYLMFEIGSIAGYIALFFSKDKMNFKKN